MFHITSTGKAQVNVFANSNQGITEISSCFQRHNSTATRYLQRAKPNKAPDPTGVKKLSKQSTRRMTQTVLDGKNIATKARNVLNLNIPPRRVQ